MKKHKKIIIWGAKHDTGHTHSYTHGALVIAGKYLGEEVYWLDDRDNVDKSFFDNSIVISESSIATTHPVSKNLPLRQTSTYVMHCLGNKPRNDRPQPSYYQNSVGRLIDFRFANNWSGDLWEYTFEPQKYTPINDGFSFLEKGLEYDNFYSMWATDLTPDQIDFESRHVAWLNPEHVFFSGTIRDENEKQFLPFIKACNDDNMKFYYNNVWQHVLTIEQLKTITLNAFLAPDIRPAHHVEFGYKSCRAFKNISYGQMGITNSRQVYDFFDQEIAFHDDPYQLFHVAKEMRNSSKTKDMILNQMKKVKEKHTYVHRMKDIITACEM